MTTELPFTLIQNFDPELDELIMDAEFSLEASLKVFIKIAEFIDRGEPVPTLLGSPIYTLSWPPVATLAKIAVAGGRA